MIILFNCPPPPPPPPPIKIADIFTEILLELTYALSFLVLLDGLVMDENKLTWK